MYIYFILYTCKFNSFKTRCESLVGLPESRLPGAAFLLQLEAKWGMWTEKMPTGRDKLQRPTFRASEANWARIWSPATEQSSCKVGAAAVCRGQVRSETLKRSIFWREREAQLN